MDFVLSKHAEVSAEEREIPLEWIRQTLEEPDLREADRRETGVGFSMPESPLAGTGCSRWWTMCRLIHGGL